VQKLIDDVAAFHNACDVPVLTKPTIPPPDRVKLRWKLVFEEVIAELGPAMAVDIVGNPLPDIEPHLPSIADAIADSIYVLVGTSLEYGIPLARVWDAVQAANMAKVGPDGKVIRREDGKILKPEGWQPADIAGILNSEG
jgi:predicted HAD superfamily Cof-like phosphohydrolase